jgi:uncharacterized protein YcbX
MNAHGYVIQQVWRYPVKSLGGQRVAASLVNERGLLGDRLWAVRDEDGKLGSGKDSRRFRRMEGLLGVTARYDAEPRAAQIEPPVVIGPDGTEHPVDSGAADQLLRGITGKAQVKVCRESDVSHFDEVAISLIGTATLDWMRGELPYVEIDPRRFRVNLVIGTSEPFIEETWLGRDVTIGAGEDAAHAVFDRVLQRCVMVGMAQPGLSESGEVLRRLGRRSDHPVCLALGGSIARPGVIRAGELARADAADTAVASQPA